MTARHISRCGFRSGSEKAFKRGGDKLRDNMNELNYQLEQLKTMNEELKEKERM